eukprot:scaffold32627_cov67-Phaeocystis_antarctica.AAC.1
MKRGGTDVTLGYFATAEEAALCVARSPEGRVSRRRAPIAGPKRQRTNPLEPVGCIEPGGSKTKGYSRAQKGEAAGWLLAGVHSVYV